MKVTISRTAAGKITLNAGPGYGLVHVDPDEFPCLAALTANDIPEKYESLTLYPWHDAEVDRDIIVRLVEESRREVQDLRGGSKDADIAMLEDLASRD